MIRLERTYRFGYQELLGQALPEIKQLADALKSPIGQAAYFYLSSVVRNEERHQAFEDNNKALDLFLNLNDTSGMIHVLSKLGADNFNLAGAEVGNQPLSENYIQKAQSLLAKRFDPHDYITTAWAVYLSIYGERPLDRQKMLEQAQQTFNQILKYSECQYYMPISKTCIAIAQYCLGNYAESYRINKEVLRIMKPRQINERVRIMLNMVNDCEFLDKDEERIKLCQEARQIMLQHNYQNWYSSEDIFLTLKEIMYKRGNYKLATEYGDSLLIAHDSLYNAQRNQKFIELQSRYQASEKQKQIAELTLKQKESESRNRFILTIFVMALLASAVLGLLWMRLRRTNAQLLDANIQLQKHTRTREQFFAIIAHDLRRPFYAFQEISNLVSYYLRGGHYLKVAKKGSVLPKSR
ncbi:MAG: hypothetical protein JNL70_01095 [Saprospiraceae bacterium]|nr:hypothetical protein [Saprospiraceae bacterium]